jgi:ABC-2 type transport system ATP-binding protein
LTIGDHLILAVQARQAFDRVYSIALLARAGLGHERRVAELSTGEQAKVALVLALATRASLLLLDEPLASLDPLARREFLTLLVEETRAHGTTVVLSSHVVADIEQACDRLVVISGGRVTLNESIEGAARLHRIVELDHLNGTIPIGVFSGSKGEQLALVRSEQGRPATTEEVVLGHLAAGPAGDT